MACKTYIVRYEDSHTPCQHWYTLGTDWGQLQTVAPFQAKEETVDVVHAEYLHYTQRRRCHTVVGMMSAVGDSPSMVRNQN